MVSSQSRLDVSGDLPFPRRVHSSTTTTTTDCNRKRQTNSPPNKAVLILKDNSSIQWIWDMFCMSTKTAAATPPPASAPTTCMPIYYASEDKQIRKHCKRCLNAGIPRVKTAVYCRKCQVPLCLSAKNNCFKRWHDNL